MELSGEFISDSFLDVSEEVVESGTSVPQPQPGPSVPQPQPGPSSIPFAPTHTSTPRKTPKAFLCSECGELYSHRTWLHMGMFIINMRMEIFDIVKLSQKEHECLSPPLTLCTFCVPSS